MTLGQAKSRFQSITITGKGAPLEMWLLIDSNVVVGYVRSTRTNSNVPLGHATISTEKGRDLGQRNMLPGTPLLRDKILYVH